MGQNCGCKSQPELNEIISCKKTIFKNGAKIYRQFNCDSSWVVFKNKNKKKQILYTLNGLVELSERLGYVNWFEYKNTFLIQNNVISGCCDPPEYILFDKENGILKKEIGPILFYSENLKFPIVVSLDINSNDFLNFINLDTNKNFKIKLPKGRIDKTLQISGEMFPEHLFDDGQIENGIFEIQYRYKIKEGENEDDNWIEEKITVDLRKYVS